MVKKKDKIDKEVKEENIEKVEEAIEETGVSEKVAKVEAVKAEEISEDELAKAAEAESTETETEAESQEKPKMTLEEKKKALLERAATLKAEKTDQPDTQKLKEEIKAKKKADMLIDLEEYVRTGIYLGTRVVTPDMKKYVYRRRADGLAIFNTDLIDEKLKEGIEYLSKFNPEDIILACKRQTGWKVAKKFGEVTGIRVFTKKYPAGTMTNTKLDTFFETELSIITDHWLDKNALKDTVDMKKNVLMICGTNNFNGDATQTIIGNNKSAKSIGLIFYLLARGYLKARDEDTSKLGDMEWWTSGDEE